MLNFDPRTLGAYAPCDHHSIQDIPEELIQAIESGSIHAVDDMLENDLIPQDDRAWIREEKEQWEFDLLTGAVFMDPFRVEWAWRCFWDHLIAGDCIAKAVDDRCMSHDIDGHFWTTRYATEVFASGVIVETPPYRPHGRVFISDHDLNRLTRLHYRQGYQSILPMSPGLSANMEEFSDLYSSTVMCEAQSISRKKAGAPIQIDKADFLIEVFALIQERKVFKSKAQLAQLASDNYAIKDVRHRRPSRKWAEDLVGKVWDRLGMKSTPVSEIRRSQSEIE